MRRGRTGWTVVFPQFGLNAHCFEAKSNRSSLKACPNQFKSLSLLRIRFSFSPLGNRDDIFPQPPSVSTMSTKGNGQNRFGDFRFPRAGGLMHVSLLYAVSDGPSRALVVRLHAVIPPAGVQPPRHTRGARHGTHSPADGSFKPLRFGTRPLPRCRLLSLKSSSALSRVGLRGRAPHGGPQSPNPRAPRAAEPCAPFRNCVGNAPFARIGFCVEEAQGAFSRGRKCFSPSIYWGRTENRDKLSRKNRDKGAAESPLRGGAPDAILCSCFPSAGGPSGRCRAEANDDSGLSRPGRQSGLTRENTGPCAPVSPPTDTKGYETRWICRPPRPRA